ncbi:MAG: 1-deoxy-D-xylulose-5-phosphate reductoisomerase [Flavobacteriales bacterium]|jgi:1-deoxy-D-xylulose-5-phosphate reductoisomerase|nr:1-deoxy-D-xylulose-5-phosphate reductoisomerase [Flavobacteriales bacterium]MBT3963040.1 1-deoxy-D-xylulose-5-phosphate reductoisomerase [Flavobacteriales bacterium]MBT4704291.1 1-deoxy-D-xylulose-5-phosphate reductoisomerase [Flavobacteriales bacterium]MBT4930553.1 1-deoxy-D-xylulose-5-phosphate reductoisomerase [Flavobacteriales bacterium]MBT5131828.1 1-deoxy-D-xylulose-5-phosphate reductoisomerase [Flavobacteriales bacterium]
MSEEKRRGLAILGSTGSIGTQALDVLSEQEDHFSLELLTAGNNSKLLIEQAKKYKPNAVVIVNEDKYKEVSDALWEDEIKVFAGADALEQCVEMEDIDMVLTGLVGFAGLRPTMKAITAGKQIALANKETLVVAGELVTKAASESGVNIYPVDSEHSAIFQCLAGEFHNKIEKIYLTASGGPFRGRSRATLADVTKAQALKHPNWDMGAKITIDSATMMNKGLEVIEAKWLFNLKPEQIDVIVHPQSIIHSAVQFEDGSMKAQMGLPDMKLPIQYALAYPNRLSANFPRFNFMDYPSLTFEAPDTETFGNLALAFKAMEEGGSMPCVLNAANEVAVDAFLNDKIKFLQIQAVIEETMQKTKKVEHPSVDEYIEIDREARATTRELIK